MPRAITQSDDSRIEQLVVSGRGQEAVEALQSVKNRIDGNTTVCLMNNTVVTDIPKIFSTWGELSVYADNAENAFGVQYVGLPDGCQVVCLGLY